LLTIAVKLRAVEQNNKQSRNDSTVSAEMKV